MSGEATSKGKVLTRRFAGLIFAAAILIFILATLLTGGDESPEDKWFIQVRDLSRLSTIEMKLSTVVKVVNPRGIWGDEVLVYGVCGSVVAGIDLSKLEKKDVKVDGRKIHIKLPPAEMSPPTLLLENDAREVPRYQLDGKKRWVEMHSACEYTYDWHVSFFPWIKKTPELVAHAQEEALKAFVRTAEENGIREMAQTEAEKQLEKLLRLAGFETIEFEVKQEIQPRPELP